MASVQHRSRHCSIAVWHFSLDVVLYTLAFYGAAIIRFRDPLPDKFYLYLPALICGGLAMASVLYVLGMYSVRRLDFGRRWNLTMVTIGLVAGLLITLAIGSMIFSARVGRGVLLGALPAVIPLILAHHYLVQRRFAGISERCALLVTSALDERGARWLADLGRRSNGLVGIITAGDYKPVIDLPVLGRLEDIESQPWPREVRRIICSTHHLSDELIGRDLRSLRFHGVDPIAMTTVFEESLHAVPLQLVDSWWLLNAAEQIDMRYIRKFKRLFDIFVSLSLLILSAPLLLAAMLAVRLTSPGPVFYRQERSGRMGTRFTCYKLRSMRPDAERDGARWSADNDPRVTRVGALLRKFRIDEIPQLVNVLRGEMSFVGPRPERPEFVDQLSREIPCYRERLLVQPGLTGWAQVNYRYGSTVDDARRKLEYDLYYIKHMSLLLDVFILLDTVRIVIRGGVSDASSATLRRVVDSIREDSGRVVVRDGVTTPAHPSAADGTPA